MENLTTDSIIEGQLYNMKGSIISESRHLRSEVQKLISELKDVEELTNQVEEKIDDAIHFPTDIWRNHNWANICNGVAKLDAQIKSFHTLKNIIAIYEEKMTAELI